MKKSLICLCLAVLVLGACGTKKLLTAGIASSKIPDITKTTVTIPNFKITVQDSKEGIPTSDQLVKNTSYVVPLPFFAFYKQHYTCTPGQGAFASLAPGLEAIFSNEVKEAGFADDLKSSYNLKLKVEETNFKFEYMNKGTIIVLLILTIRNKNEYVAPMTCSMKVSYELSKDNAVIKKGTISKEEVVTSKISTGVPLPTGPTYKKNPAYSPHVYTGQPEYTYNTRNDYQQLQGGTYTEARHAMTYGYTVMFNLMSNASKDICSEIKSLVK
jgi:hypothetical protein